MEILEVADMTSLLLLLHSLGASVKLAILLCTPGLATGSSWTPSRLKVIRRFTNLDFIWTSSP